MSLLLNITYIHLTFWSQRAHHHVCTTPIVISLLSCEHIEKYAPSYCQLHYSFAGTVGARISSSVWHWYQILLTLLHRCVNTINPLCGECVWPISTRSGTVVVSLSLMPKKVPFKVVYCTGWEDDYPPKDLEVRAANSFDDEFIVTVAMAFVYY